jgi:hypothetical protein
MVQQPLWTPEAQATDGVVPRFLSVRTPTDEILVARGGGDPHFVGFV